MASKNALGKLAFGSLTASTFGLGAWQTMRFFEEKPEPQPVQLHVRDLDLSKTVWVGPRSDGQAKKRGFFAFAPSAKDQILLCLGWSAEKPSDISGASEQLSQNDSVLLAYTRRGEKGNRFSPPNPPQGPFLWMEENAMFEAAGLNPESSTLAETYVPIIPNRLQTKTKPEPYLTKWTHAGYALTWYSLSVAGIVMMKRMFR